MNYPLWKQVLEFVKVTTEEVGEELLKQFGQVQGLEKDDGSLVTQADQWADRQLQERILAQFPDHGVLTEETAQHFPDTPWCWIVDPIDGTTNFTRGVPLWGISMALLYQGTPVFGYLYFPPIRHSFYGFWNAPSELEGHPVGAFLNDRPITPTSDQPSHNHFFNLCNRCARTTSVLQADSAPFPCKIRMLGVATYSILTVSAGIAIGGIEATPKIWDIAAVWAISHAAGVVWVPLTHAAPFPLISGEDYHHYPYPTLVVSHSQWVELFQPWIVTVTQ
ncbi:MAG: inositol monophosphatase family protein [Roseofilum sp. SBFL]|uniref:inositol monophosphatase family protein n=1 Tax=unclassified Roseofilum TaxID=2620099 RepID=UPI001B1E567E|nr:MULTISPECIES: inositol monophosphatase family protein [unclassified Roseofilum]MBP0015153.1 inositol monophosphatase family protein [Roseofilum sp. SID3]MBP0023953.1 inositol monophosphatase family protein [Roseofilum sp. SID2]MBP0039195.1 inositol monophosphatase family protein [Roseofilum sp. SID1]MBP0043291.1 inositol monophosphatase family protein [Roseofilum sp. SBFL]